MHTTLQSCTQTWPVDLRLEGSTSDLESTENGSAPTVTRIFNNSEHKEKLEYRHFTITYSYHESQKQMLGHVDWSAPLHAGEREAACSGGAGLLTLEETGNYRATCRRCRDEVPERDCKQPVPELVPYIEEFRLQRVCPPDEPGWFQTEPGCCYRVHADAFEIALREDDVPGAVSVFHISCLDDSLEYVQSVQMVQGLRAAGAEFTPYIADMLCYGRYLPAVASALEYIDINSRDVQGGMVHHCCIELSVARRQR